MKATKSASKASGSRMHLHQSRQDLKPEVRQQVINLLNKTLATTLDLKTQVKQAHWNVKGTDFYQLHLLFDEIAKEVEDYSDLVAERVTALAGTALGTARIAAEKSVLPEYPHEITSGKEHLNALADRLAAYASHVRNAIDKTDDLGDKGTADIYTEISRGIDSRLWFIEAHLQ